MDLLYQRYSNPSELMQTMLDCNRFSEWITETLNIKNAEVENDTLFDIWLHKVFEQSYSEFLNSVKKPSKPVEQTVEQDIETTVKESAKIAGVFL